GDFVRETSSRRFGMETEDASCRTSSTWRLGITHGTGAYAAASSSRRDRADQTAGGRCALRRRAAPTPRVVYAASQRRCNMSDLDAARAAMGATLAFHMVFAALGVGMPILLSLAEGLGLFGGDTLWYALARRWSQAFSILFIVGAISGTA